MNIEVFKIYILKPAFLGGTNSLDWFLRKFSRFLKETIVFDVSI